MTSYGKKVQMRSAAADLRFEAKMLERQAERYKSMSDAAYNEYNRMYKLYEDAMDVVGSKEDEAYRLERIAGELA